MAPKGANMVSPRLRRSRCLGLLFGAGYYRFALFEADRSIFGVISNPRLRRYAPYLGLTMWHLSEVLNCVTDLNVNCEL